jgi:exopolyphosphatase/guanosine-5'-triphosphate,3'-diphosphate pyrophosphatase
MFSVGDPAKAGRLVWLAKKRVLELELSAAGQGLFGEVAQARFQALALAMKAETRVTRVG